MNELKKVKNLFELWVTEGPEKVDDQQGIRLGRDY
jgi:hypothetical protein